MTDGPRAQFTGREVRIIFVGLMLGMFLPAVNTTVVATALPAIADELGGLTGISWIMTAYLLAATVAVPLVGKASDLYGRRPLFQLAILTFVLASLLCGLSLNIAQLVAARALQGAAGGSLMALGMTTIADVVAPRERGRYQGYIGALFAVASLVGPLVGGVLVDLASWRWTFHLNVPLGLLALLATSRFLRLEHQPRHARIDYLGASLFTVAAAALLLVSVWGGQRHPWGSPTILSLAVVGAVAFAAFVAVELRASEPVLPLVLFRNRVFTVGGALSIVSGGALFIATTYAPVFFQTVAGTSATASGFALLPLMIGVVLASTSSGRIITWWGRYRVFPILGALSMAAGYLALSRLDTGATLVMASVPLALIGAGLGFTLGVVTLAIQNSVAPADLGVATAAVQFFRMAGGAFGLAVFASMVNTALSRWARTGLPPEADLQHLDLSRGITDPDTVTNLPDHVAAVLPTGLAEAITSSFFAMVPLLGLTFLLAWWLPELPLKEEIGSPEAGRSGGCRGPRRPHDDPRGRSNGSCGS